MRIIKEGLDFDDVLLVPEVSHTISSRDDIDISVQLENIKLDIPIIASPMKGIIGKELIVELDRLGGIGIMHRFYTSHDKWRESLHYISNKVSNFGGAVGMDDSRYKNLLDFGAKIICVDVANGYLDSLRTFCNIVSNHIDKNGYDCLLMSGNVVTPYGAEMLYLEGVDLIRVGIGSGGLCITRNVTGVGYPQLSAIMDCAGFYKKGSDYENIGALYKRIEQGYYTVADGGIRNSGDIVKSLAAGADVVMIGSLFGNAKESANNGTIYGMASARQQEEYYHGVKSIEGIEKKVNNDRDLADIVNELVWGIKSACTYLGCKNISDISEDVIFIRTGKGSLKEYRT
jgi:IMP dehydrogenase